MCIGLFAELAEKEILFALLIETNVLVWGFMEGADFLLVGLVH
jgi:hypothetical protein